MNGPLDNVATASTSDEDANRAQDTDCEIQMKFTKALCIFASEKNPRTTV